MAKFRIQGVTGTISGQAPNVPARLDVSTGEEAVSEGLADIGGALIDIGHKAFRAQGEVELAHALSEDEAALNKLFLDYEKETDPTTYAERYEEVLSQIDARQIKNGWAAREHALAVSKSKSRWANNVAKAIQWRISDNLKHVGANMKAKAVQAGMTGHYEAFLNNQVEQGRMTADEAELELTETKYLASQQQMATLAGTDPKWILDNIKNVADMKEAFPDAKATDFRWLIGMAKAGVAGQKSDEELFHEGLVHEALVQAPHMNLEEFKDHLGTIVNLTVEERYEMLRVYSNARRFYEDRGVNPWASTINYPRLDQMFRLLRSDAKVTAKDLQEAWLVDGVPQWNVLQQESLRDQVTARNEPTKLSRFYGDPMVNTLLDNYDKFFHDDEGELLKGQYEPWANGRYLLEGDLKKAQGDPVKMKAAYDERTSGLRQQKAKGFLRRAVDGTFKMWWWQVQPTYFRAVDLASKAIQPPATSDLPRPKTPDEVEQLPSGTWFIDPQGQKRYKP